MYLKLHMMILFFQSHWLDHRKIRCVTFLEAEEAYMYEYGGKSDPCIWLE